MQSQASRSRVQGQPGHMARPCFKTHNKKTSCHLYQWWKIRMLKDHIRTKGHEPREGTKSHTTGTILLEGDTFPCITFRPMSTALGSLVRENSSGTWTKHAYQMESSRSTRSRGWKTLDQFPGYTSISTGMELSDPKVPENGRLKRSKNCVSLSTQH